MKKLFVILGKGYVGQYLASTLKNYSLPFEIWSKRDVDYTNPTILHSRLSILARQNEVVVVNCAGYTGVPNVDGCEEPSAKPVVYQMNSALPVQLAIVCKQIPNVNFIHISSGCIYNGYNKVFSETDQPNFGFFNEGSSFYSKTKHLAELGLKNLEYGVMLRVRMIFGPDEQSRNFITKIKKYSHLIVNENSMTNVVELCEFIIQFCAQNLDRTHDVYNVVNEGSISLKAIAAYYNSVSCEPRTWLFASEADLKLKAKRSNCILDTSKIRKLGLTLKPVSESILTCLKG